MNSFPSDALEFQRMFSTEEQCERFLADLRWPNGFVCVMHKLRHAMGRRDEGITLAGFIEMDEAILGPEARRPVAEAEVKAGSESTKKPRKPRKKRLGRKPKDGRKRKEQTEVLILVESERFHAGNVAMQMLERTTYETVKHMGHKFIARKSMPETACAELPIVHRVISLLKHFLMGTYFGVSPKYLPGYLQEFCFRLIRREKQYSLSESLLRACVKNH